MPSADMVKVIEYLLHPDHFVGVTKTDQSESLQAINAVLASLELEVTLNPRTHVPRLVRMDGSFVSTAIDVAEAVKRIRYERDSSARLLRFIAVRAINAGEELTINYNAYDGAAISDNDWWFEEKKVRPITG
jgi:hypothetical protein